MVARKASSKAGPPSSLKTGEGSPTGASAGGDNDFEGRRGSASAGKAQSYSVQIHTDEKGLEVVEVSAESGDEAAQKALAQKNYRGASVRGVTPVSDPDPNSMGGERDAGIMIANAENGGDAGRDLLGTEANRKATEELGKADIKELGE
jgi:ribosomal protein S11